MGSPFSGRRISDAECYHWVDLFKGVCRGLLRDYRTSGALLVLNGCDGDAVCISFRGRSVHAEVLDSKDEKLNK